MSYEHQKIDRRKELVEGMFAHLYQLQKEYWEDTTDILAGRTIVPGGKAKLINYPLEGTLGIWLPGVPPFVRKYTKGSAKNKEDIINYWTGLVSFAVNKLEYIPSYEKNLIIVEYNMPKKTRPWDVDNILISPLVNALRICTVIADDSYQNTSILATGKQSSYKPYTRIFVINLQEENILSFIAKGQNRQPQNAKFWRIDQVETED